MPAHKADMSQPARRRRTHRHVCAQRRHAVAHSSASAPPCCCCFAWVGRQGSRAEFTMQQSLRISHIWRGVDGAITSHGRPASPAFGGIPKNEPGAGSGAPRGFEDDRPHGTGTPMFFDHLQGLGAADVGTAGARGYSEVAGSDNGGQHLPGRATTGVVSAGGEGELLTTGLSRQNRSGGACYCYCSNEQVTLPLLPPPTRLLPRTCFPGSATSYSLSSRSFKSENLADVPRHCPRPLFPNTPRCSFHFLRSAVPFPLPSPAGHRSMHAGLQRLGL